MPAFPDGLLRSLTALLALSAALAAFVDTGATGVACAALRGSAAVVARGVFVALERLRWSVTWVGRPPSTNNKRKCFALRLLRLRLRRACACPNAFAAAQHGRAPARDTGTFTLGAALLPPHP